MKSQRRRRWLTKAWESIRVDWRAGPEAAAAATTWSSDGDWKIHDDQWMIPDQRCAIRVQVGRTRSDSRAAGRCNNVAGQEARRATNGTAMNDRCLPTNSRCLPTFRYPQLKRIWKSEKWAQKITKAQKIKRQLTIGLAEEMDGDMAMEENRREMGAVQSCGWHGGWRKSVAGRPNTSPFLFKFSLPEGTPKK